MERQLKENIFMRSAEVIKNFVRTIHPEKRDEKQQRKTIVEKLEL